MESHTGWFFQEKGSHWQKRLPLVRGAVMRSMTEGIEARIPQNVAWFHQAQVGADS